MSKAELQLASDIASFYSDPLGFVLYAYPWGKPGRLSQHDGPDAWQREFLTDLGNEVKKRGFDGVTPVAPIRMATSSGHGIGKSTLVAWLVDWIMSTRPGARGTVTADTFQQLDTKTWAAIVEWTRLCVTAHWFEITSDSIYFRDRKDSWRVAAQSCREENSEAFAGQHAANSTSFVIGDEASAVPDKILEVAEGAMTDGEPMIFLFGNPTRSSGKFHRVMFGSERARWVTRTVDSRHSRFTNKQQIAEWIQDFGEDSDFVRVRVRGEAPRQGNCQLVPSEVVEQCRKMQLPLIASMPKILSVDPARFGDDRTVIGLRQGRIFRVLGKYRGLDTLQVAERVIACIAQEKPALVVVDGDGLGAGVFDHVKYRAGSTRLHEFRGGMRAFNEPKYRNRRAEVWCEMADALKAGMSIPDDPEITTDLTAPEYCFSSKGQICLESKDMMKARGLASPDIGDTLAMTFAQKVLPTPPQPSRPRPYFHKSVWS